MGKSKKSLTRDYQESLPDQNPDWKKINFFNNFFFSTRKFSDFFVKDVMYFGSRKITEFLDFRYFGVVDPSRVLRSALYCTHLLYSSVLSIARVSARSDHSALQKSWFFDFGGGYFPQILCPKSSKTMIIIRCLNATKTLENPEISNCSNFFSTEPILIIFGFLKSYEFSFSNYRVLEGYRGNRQNPLISLHFDAF